MEDKLTDIEGAGEGTVLEMKEERGLGKTLDVILYRGSVKKGDEIVLVTEEGGVSTHVRGMFAPRGMSEMRDAGNRWDDTEAAQAASGLKISAPSLDGVLAGTTLRVVSNDTEREEALALADAEANLSVELDEEGVTIKADTVGGLEALAKELRAVEVPIRHASIGKVNRRDVRTAENSNDPLHRIILAFATEILPDAEEDIENSARNIISLGAKAVLIKGGGLKDMKGKDFFLDLNGRKEWLFNDFINTKNTHGSGCTLSAAICGYKALGFELLDSIKKAKLFVEKLSLIHI